jgi:hypothetical protein
VLAIRVLLDVELPCQLLDRVGRLGQIDDRQNALRKPIVLSRDVGAGEDSTRSIRLMEHGTNETLGHMRHGTLSEKKGKKTARGSNGSGTLLAMEDGKVSG